MVMMVMMMIMMTIVVMMMIPNFILDSDLTFSDSRYPPWLLRPVIY